VRCTFWYRLHPAGGRGTAKYRDAACLRTVLVPVFRAGIPVKEEKKLLEVEDENS
jgi:hypothetical protein